MFIMYRLFSNLVNTNNSWKYMSLFYFNYDYIWLIADNYDYILISQLRIERGLSDCHHYYSANYHVFA